MTVYIDPMVDHGVRRGRAGPRWCHMVADSEDELHQFAHRIGLARSWYQEHPVHPHYDIGSDRIHALAIRAGAQEITRQEMGQRMLRRASKEQQ